MLKEFCTYLVTYTGALLPRNYIGSTTVSKALSGNYYGSVSSVKWKAIFEYEVIHNRDKFSIEILSYHNTRIEALEEELTLQKFNDVVKSDKFFNESLACPNGFFGRNFNHSNESKKKIGVSSKCRSYIDRDFVGEKNPMHGKRFKQTDIAKNKISLARKNVKQTRLECPHCNKIGGTTMYRWHFDKCKNRIEHA